MNSQENVQRSKWGILFTLVLFPFMAALDSNIVNVALPVMSDKLHVTSSMIAWVPSVYLITLTACILFFGKLGDQLGQTRIFHYGTLVFTLGSFLCGLSASFEFLLFSRIIQALGAAATMATNQAIITRTFPKTERGRALGINGAFVALGTLLGPSLGGFIITVAGWEYMFWINVPIGLVIFARGFRIFPKEERGPHAKFDILGSVLFALSMVGFFVALEQGQALGFGSPFILFCFGVSIVCFSLFLAVQKRRENPLLDLSIFKNMWFSVSIFCAFTSYMAISSYNIIMPFYLQDVLLMTPVLAGLFMTIYPMIIVVVSPLSGFIADRRGCETLTLFGLVLTAAGLLFMTVLGTGVSLILLAAFIVIMAFGNGLFQSPNNALVMSSVAQHELGVGGSVNALVRCLGQTAGIAVSGAVLYGGMSAKLHEHVTDFVPGQNDAFIYGMHMAYLVAAAVCLAGCALTALRLFGKRKNRGNSAGNKE